MKTLSLLSTCLLLFFTQYALTQPNIDLRERYIANLSDEGPGLEKRLLQIPNLKVLAFDLFIGHKRIPVNLSRFPQLEVIVMSSIRDLSEDDINQISALPNLKELYLDLAVNFKALSPKFGHCKKLETLYFNLSKYGEALPKSLAQLKNLKNLYIVGESQSSLGKDLALIGELTNLEKLSLWNINLDGLPTFLSKLPNLKVLELNGSTCQNWQGWVDELAKLPNLEVIGMPNNLAKADYSALKKVREITFYYQFKPSILAGYDFPSFYNRSPFNNNYEQLLPSLQTFPQLQRVQFPDKYNSFLEFVKIADWLNEQESSSFFGKQQAFLDWLTAKLSVASFKELNQAMEQLEKDKIKFAELNSNDQIVKEARFLTELNSAESTEKYGLELIEKAKNRIGVDAQDMEAVIYYYIGQAYKGEEQWTTAYKYYKKCHKIRKQRKDDLLYSWNHFVYWAIEKGDWKKLDKFIKLRANSMTKQGKTESAVNFFFSSTHFWASSVALTKGDYKVAEQYFLKAAVIDPDFLTWTQEAIFYQQAYRTLYNKGTRQEQLTLTKNWINNAYKLKGANEARWAASWLIGDLHEMDGNDDLAADVAKLLVDFERGLKDNEISEPHEHALKLQCYILMQTTRVEELIDAYKQLLDYDRKQATPSPSTILYGLNELISKIFYKYMDKEVALRAFNELQQWQKEEKDPIVSSWLLENIKFIRDRLDF